MKLLLVVALLAGAQVTPAPATIGLPSTSGTSSSPYDDPRLARWAGDFVAGRFDAVISSVETDLRSPSPHPFAAMVWTATEDRRGKLAEAVASADAPLRASLAELPEIYQLQRSENFDRILDLYPPSRFSSLHDVWSLSLLFAAYLDRDRLSDAQEAIFAEGALRDDLFEIPIRGVWLVEHDRRLSADASRLSRGTFAPIVSRGMLAAPWQPEDGNAFAREWLADRPNDAFALRYLGHELVGSERYPEAVIAYEQSERIFPFFGFNWSESHAAALLQAGRPEEAERLLHRDTDGGALPVVEPLIQSRWANLLLATGDRGRARTVLEAAARHWPDRADLQSAFGSLEIASGRPAAAVGYARRAVALEPGNRSARALLVGALKSAGQPEEAIAAFESAEKEVAWNTREFYWDASEILGTQGRKAERIAVSTRAVAKAPSSTLPLYQLAVAYEEAGDLPHRLAALLARVDIDPETVSAYASALPVSKDGSVQPELVALQKRFPRVDITWSRGSGLKKQEALAHARERLLAREWPWEQAIDLYLADEKFDEARVLADGMLVAMSAAPPGQRALALKEWVYFATQKSKTSRLSDADAKRGLALLEELRAIGGSQVTYLSSRETLFNAMDNPQAAFSEALALADLHPDGNGAEVIIAHYARQSKHREGWVRLRRRVERDPYSQAAMDAYLEMHGKWGGSPVLAILAGEEMKARGLDYDSFTVAIAWNNLGFTAGQDCGTAAGCGEFEAYWGHATAIADSNRYVNWYESARRQTRENDGPLEALFDSKEGIVRILHRDGLIEARKDDLRTGFALMRQYGSEIVRAEYDPILNRLIHVSSASGTEARMTFDAIGRRATFAIANEAYTLEYRGDSDEPIAFIARGGMRINVPGDDEIESRANYRARSHAGDLLDEIDGIERALVARQMPHMPEKKDPTLRALWETYAAASSGREAPMRSPEHLAFARAHLALGKHFVEHVADAPGNRRQAEAALSAALKASLAAPSGSVLAGIAVDAGELWYRLYAPSTKEDELLARNGQLDEEQWLEWIGIRSFLDREVPRRPRTEASRRTSYAAIQAAPLHLRKGDRWLSRSPLSNEGYWRNYPDAEVVPQKLGANRLAAILVRRNGDVVAGGRQGLSVLHRGFWRWYGFDTRVGHFSSDAPLGDVASGNAEVLALAEDNAGALWVGMAREGLLRLAGPYDGKPTRWRPGAGGLSSPRVESLAADGASIWVGSPSGLRRTSGDTLEEVDGFSTEHIRFLRSGAEGGPLLIGTDRGLFAWTGKSAVALTAMRLDDAITSQEEPGTIILLRESQVFTLSWDGTNAPGVPLTLNDQADIQKTATLYGLAYIATDDPTHATALAGDDDESTEEANPKQPLGKRRTLAITILTDQGLSVLHDSHIEHVFLPLLGKRAAAHALASSADRTFILTSEGVESLEVGQVTGDHRGRVYDLLTDTTAGVTWVARGSGGIEVVRHEDPTHQARKFDDVAATHLALAADGALIANDDWRILRYPRGSVKAEDLFDATPSAPDLTPQDLVTSLIVAHDGSVWVSAGFSVFHWKDGKAEEFNISTTAAVFPARSDRITRVLETVDGHIWVTCSDEGFRNFHGQSLDGGVLQWNGTRFERLPLRDATKAWLLTSYTALSPTKAIAGSTHGFVLQDQGRVTSFDDLQDKSYDSLRAINPRLWLGTRGARLADDFWIFGTAGGVVAYRSGVWFDPDRLNWLLPDQHLSQYGGRIVHAIETDPEGRIYAGTDAGLTIFDSDGADPMRFLVSRDRGPDFFGAADEERRRSIVGVLVDKAPPGSAFGVAIAQLREQERDIHRLETKIGRGTDVANLSLSPKLDMDREKGTRDALRAELDVKTTEHRRFMARIQQEDIALYRSLEIKPLDLVSVRARLPADAAIVQYLPEKRKLYIQVVSRDSVEKTEVAIGSENLQLVALRAARNLAHDATSPQLMEDLSLLYETLLRPVEGFLEGKRHVFISPVGALTYVPFGAFIRSTDPKPAYAVDRYAFGYITTLFQLETILNRDVSHSAGTLIMADPDGSLAFAKEEAEKIAKAMHSSLPPKTGKKVTIDALREFAPSSRLVHLATHAKLNALAPDTSFLLFANGARLTIPEIQELPLGHTDLVVLSACESGIGTDGMEFFTLADAFVHAGVPSIVASLWAVDDKATDSLMEGFYTRLAAGEDIFDALAHSQSELAQTSGPGGWAAFIPMGRPNWKN